MKNNVRSKTTARWSTILVCSGVLALSLLAVQPTQANAATDATNTTAVAASPAGSQESSSAAQSETPAATPEGTSEATQTPVAAPVENSSDSETNPTTPAATDKYATSVTTSNIAPTGATVQTYSSDDANTDAASPVTYKPSTTASTDTSVTSYDAVITHDANQHPFSVNYTTATVDAAGNIKTNPLVSLDQTKLQAYIPKNDDGTTDDTTFVIPNVKTISNDTNLPTSFLQSINVVYALDQVITSVPVTRTINYVLADGASLAPGLTLPEPDKQTVTYLASNDSADPTAPMDYYDPMSNGYTAVTTPKLAGYTADKEIVDAEWPMVTDELPENEVVTVTYTPNIVTGDVTIPSNLGDKSGGTKTGNTGDKFQVPVPAVEGYTPDKTTVEAVINGDGTITATTPVTYTANSTGTTGGTTGTTGTTGTGSTTPTNGGTTGTTTTTPNAQTDANPTATPGTTTPETTATTPTTTGTTSTNQNENEPTNSGEITKGPKAGQNTQAPTGSTTLAGATTTAPTGTAANAPTGATTTAPTAQASNVTTAAAQNATTAATLPQTSETTANSLAVIGASLLAMLAGLFGFKIRDRKH